MIQALGLLFCLYFCCQATASLWRFCTSPVNRTVWAGTVASLFSVKGASVGGALHFSSGLTVCDWSYVFSGAGRHVVYQRCFFLFGTFTPVRHSFLSFKLLCIWHDASVHVFPQRKRCFNVDGKSKWFESVVISGRRDLQKVFWFLTDGEGPGSKGFWDEKYKQNSRNKKQRSKVSKGPKECFVPACLH